MTLYLHPNTNVADAAIYAYEHGGRLVTKSTHVEVKQGRDVRQYHKALAIKGLDQLAREIKSA